MKIAV